MDWFAYEKKARENGYKTICGIDEAGRGPLAGPVVCAAVIMPLDKESIIEGVNDSKQLTPKVREELYDKIINKAISYSVSYIDEKIIDKINILNATKEGMLKCVNNLAVIPDILLIDAVKLKTEIPQENIIHGDELSYSIAAASILAKVSRDRYMEEMDKSFPQYNFKQHKGYATKEHISKLKEFGCCNIHRRSFIKHFISDDGVAL